MTSMAKPKITMLLHSISTVLNWLANWIHTDNYYSTHYPLLNHFNISVSISQLTWKLLLCINLIQLALISHMISVEISKFCLFTVWEWAVPTFTLQALSEQSIQKWTTVVAECWPLTVMYWESMWNVDVKSRTSTLQ